MTSESSHCGYSGLRCNAVLKALKAEVQKGSFCIAYSLFFRLSSQSCFFPLDRLNASLNPHTHSRHV